MTGKVISMAQRGREPSSLVLLTRLAKQVYRQSRDRDLDMQLRHLVALSFLRDHEACPQQELADAFCMDANNVVLLLNELEDAEYASRQRDPHDRRRHVVQLSPAGTRALEDAEKALEAVEDDVLGALDADERKVLWRLLTRALRGVEPADLPPAPVGASSAA
jgi:DNA-binding MarR family transcriptional regulator